MTLNKEEETRKNHLLNSSDADILQILNNKEHLYHKEAIETAQQVAVSRGLISHYLEKEFNVITKDGRESGSVGVETLKEIYFKNLITDESIVYVNSRRQWLPLKVVFDTNAWKKIVRPDVHIDAVEMASPAADDTSILQSQLIAGDLHPPTDHAIKTDTVKTMKTILTLFCVFFLEYATFAQTSEITYEEVKLTNVGSISIPSIMELQSGVYKEFSDSFSKELGFDVSGVIVYQQAGLNDIFKTLKRSGTYARLMIDETPGKAGEYRRLDSKLVVTPRELRLLDTQFKNGIISQFQTSGAGLKLIRWDGVSVDKISGFDVLKTAYLRQLNDNPAVYVELYLVDNYDRQYLLTISYREEDSSIWKDALNKTKNSFKITNIRKPETRSMRDATKFDLSRVSKGTANTIPTDTTMAEPTPKPFPKIISGGVVNGKATNLVKPLYPAAARAVRARGAVNVQVVIDENGNVVSASAVSGHPLLRAAAVSAARLSKFSPTLLAGQPVKVAGVVVYNFQP